ncbi:DUF1772 domain-containing protein [Sphingomonas cannabina]|uniref:anthrone oxygenase family protein n=1 Tax=Sphingomonas cannabina TaxID=2899123 RepID=UPI001F26ADEA|nr:anthrone oxygenase family protein [Sphingomonas cannabina]UIJ45471.1 DUF1772 domain-containing protein [Sphingomonas cannabina]
MKTVLCWLALIGAIGSGLMAGFFFAFSNTVMGALGRMPPAQGATAMQHVNVVVLNPLFLSVFMGTAVVGAVLAGGGVLRLGTPGAVLAIVGGLAYAIGTFGVTMMLNVPLNNQLAAADPATQEAAALWATYLKDWTFWNTVRTWAAVVAMVLLVFGWRDFSRQ